MSTKLSRLPVWLILSLIMLGSLVMLLWFTGFCPEARYGISGSFFVLLGMFIGSIVHSDARCEKMEARIQALEQKVGIEPAKGA